MIKMLSVFCVAAGLISVAATPSFACACCGTWKVTNVASWDVLNIRSGPSASYSKVGSIPSGSACVIKTGSCNGKWCPISYANKSGWVHSGYLSYFKN